MRIRPPGADIAMVLDVSEERGLAAVERLTKDESRTPDMVRSFS